MIDQSLVSYIKQNLREGFSQSEIQTALVGAGWTPQDITQAFVESGAVPAATAALPVDLTYQPDQPQSFLAKHGKLLIILLVVIILLPILAYGVFWAYERYIAAEAQPQTNTATPPPAPPPPPQAPAVDPQAAAHDRERLQDIKNLQSALDSYLGVKKVYPKLLDELVKENVISTIPLDPKSNVQYLYSPLGEPTLDYSLSFILETDAGALKKGLHEVSPSNRLEPAAVQSQDEAVRGITTMPNSLELQITNLSLTPFYPGEEVSVAVSSRVPLEQVILLVNHLKLTDSHFPFNIRFTAPKTPGEYPVQIFGFTSDSQTLTQTTKLIVKP